MKLRDNKRPNPHQALRRAAYWGDLLSLKFCIQRLTTAELNTFDPLYFCTALHFAIKQGHTDCAKALIKAGADINAQSKSGDTPLHLALKTDNRLLIMLLVQSGAKLDLTNAEGKYPAEYSKYAEFRYFMPYRRHPFLLLEDIPSSDTHRADP